MVLVAARKVRHLPTVDADRVAGVVSIGDVFKDRISQTGQKIGFLETSIKGPEFQTRVHAHGRIAGTSARAGSGRIW